MSDDTLDAPDLYRNAYALAMQVMEGRQRERASGHWREKDTAAEDVIIADVVKQLPFDVDRELVRKAVHDAAAKGLPRW